MTIPSAPRLALAIVSTEFPPGPGGIGTHAFELTRRLPSLGWRTSVVSPQDYASEEELESFARAYDLAVTRLRRVPGAPLEGAYRLLRTSMHLRRHRPSLLLASGARAADVVSVASRIHRLPWVAVAHGGELSASSSLRRATLRRVYEAADAVVCVSGHTRSHMTAQGIRARRVFVVPNGADESRFRRLDPEESDRLTHGLGLETSARLLVTVGNVCERKGQDLVVRAMPELCRRIPDLHYVAVGLPTEAARLQKLAGELGVGKRVHFTGRQDTEAVVGWMNAAAVFVMASRHAVDGDFEGFGIAVVEAALCGTPAVVTANSGLAEAVEDSRTGVVVPEENVGALARAILDMLTDEPRRRAMGEAARERALREQTWAHRAAEYDEILRMPLAESAGLATTGLASRLKGA